MREGTVIWASMGVPLDEGELDGDDCIEDDNGEEDMKVDEREGGC